MYVFAKNGKNKRPLSCPNCKHFLAETAEDESGKRCFTEPPKTLTEDQKFLLCPGCGAKPLIASDPMSGITVDLIEPPEDDK